MTGRLDDLLGLGRAEQSSWSGGGGGAGPSSEGSGGGDARFATLALSAIEANPYQPRTQFDEDGLEALAASIAEVGVLQPLLVREIDEDRYELIAGERRFRAARLAGLVEVPAVIRTVDDRRSLEEAVVENLHRADLSGVEEAAAYRQLIDEFGLTQDEVAKRVGRSRSAVANTLRLLQLPGAVQRLIVLGELSAGHARALLAVADEGTQARLAVRVVAEGLSVREVEELVRRSGSGRSGKEGAGSVPRPSGRAPAAAVLEIEALLSERLDTRVSVSITRNRGRLVVEFADLEDLERIYRELEKR